MVSPVNSNLLRDDRPTIVHVVHSLEGGGTERTLVSLLNELDRTRFRHVVMPLRGAGSLAVGLGDHIAVRPLGAKGRSWRTGFALARNVLARRADLIHARNTGCWADSTVAAVLSGRARLVLGFHGLETPAPFRRRQRCVARWALRAGATFAAVGPSGCRQLQQQALVPAGRIDVLENGVDLRRFRPVNASLRHRIRAELGLGETDFVVGAVGSLTPVKSHATLIEAIGRLVGSVPGVRLLLVGDGPLRSSLVQRARAWGVDSRVIFTGLRDDVRELLGAMDVFACSSVSEGFSNALLEALAVGLPVVTTDVGEHATLVRDNIEGFVVPPRDPDAMRRALKVLGESRSVCQRFGGAAERRSRDYGFDRTVRRYEDYYAAALKGRRMASEKQT